MRFTGLMAACVSLLSSAALADNQCAAVPGIPVERQLRQLYLDLLGRPPTVDEYHAAQAKGSIDESDVDALMKSEEFYARLQTYHRALLRTNVSASVYDNGDTRLTLNADGNKPLEMRGNPAAALRGRNGQGCDHFIDQDQCNASHQDPQLEPATKTCRDANGVPMPVSVDYDLAIYACTALSGTGVTDCASAAAAGLLKGDGTGVPDKMLYFCDNRRQTTGMLKPFLCLPDPGKPTTANMTVETLDSAGRVVTLSNAMPVAGAAFNSLDHCDLSLALKNNIKGEYTTKRGCVVREGTTTVPKPYWDTSTATTAVACAIEAQTSSVNPATLESCETSRFSGDRSCGCGVAFRRCEFSDATVNVQQARIDAVNSEPLKITDSVVRRDEDYFNILSTRRSFLNSTLAEFYQQRQGTSVWSVTPQASLTALPQMDFNSDPTQWVEYTRDANNAGVLTTPEYLYRFPTYRSRVNQFYGAFLCKAFAPPPDAQMPAPDDPCNRENNLAKRCGCTYCHATIEPTGAHWGRWGERNATYLDPTLFPKYSAKCHDCALAGNTTCDGDCDNYVMTAQDGDGASSLGLLKTYLYRTPEEELNITGGPAALVQRMMQTGDLERCAVQNVWKEFLGRPMTQQEQDLYMESLVQQWQQKGRSMKELIKLLMATDAYRRID
jgi:hypothetical protein